MYEEHGGIALAQDEGRAIANALGRENIACILQNHGLAFLSSLADPRLGWQMLIDIRRLITVGSTVDEAAFLFYSLDKACHSQLMAEAAAANGVAKKIIPDKVAKFTAESVQDPVWQLGFVVVDKANYRSIISISSFSLSLSLSWRSLMGRCFCRYRNQGY